MIAVKFALSLTTGRVLASTRKSLPIKDLHGVLQYEALFIRRIDPQHDIGKNCGRKQNKQLPQRDSRVSLMHDVYEYTAADGEALYR